MKGTELLTRLRQALSAAEWEALERGTVTAVSSFNRTVLLEMRSASVPEDREVPMEQAAGLYETLRDYLAAYMSDQTHGWKYVILASLYLTFVVRRPMHPSAQLGIQVVETAGKVFYMYPSKSAVEGTVCDYCVCQNLLRQCCK